MHESGTASVCSMMRSARCLPVEKFKKVPHVPHIVATMEAKGDDLVHQAEQALKKWSLFSGGDKFEDAADKYQRAGNAYKASKACA